MTTVNKNPEKYRIVRTSYGDIYQRLWKGMTIYNAGGSFSGQGNGLGSARHNVNVPTQWRTLDSNRQANKIEEIKNCSAILIVIDSSYFTYLANCEKVWVRKAKVVGELEQLYKLQEAGNLNIFRKIGLRFRINKRCRILKSLSSYMKPEDFMNSFPKYEVEHRQVS